jgi:hypothetical protein
LIARGLLLQAVASRGKQRRRGVLIDDDGPDGPQHEA